MKVYRTWVFDCDGVILNSNQVKTQAFYGAAEAYGDKAASALVDYHVRNGGISRYAKFEYFLTQIVGRANADAAELEKLLSAYADRVEQGLRECEVAAGLSDLRSKTSSSRWLVVSGGDQAELREVFQDRGLSSLFDGGIYGSPDDKDEILGRELQAGVIAQPAVFIGDSQYDFEAATRAGLDFVFLSNWSESDFHFNEATYRSGSIQELLDNF